jgi:hypothetical protein
MSRSVLALDTNRSQDVVLEKTAGEITVKTAGGALVSMPLDVLLHLLLIEKTGVIEEEGRKIAQEIEGKCRQTKMIQSLYEKVLTLSDKNGSIDWKKQGLGPEIEALRREGFSVPVKDGVISREERDVLLRSLDQQRDDLSTEVSQLNVKLNRCYTLRDDCFRAISQHLSSLNESCKKIFRGIGG